MRSRFRRRANHADDNGAHGIEIQAGSIDNEIVANEALGNGSFDVEDLNPTCVNELRNNRFDTAFDAATTYLGSAGTTTLVSGTA